MRYALVLGIGLAMSSAACSGPPHHDVPPVDTARLAREIDNLGARMLAMDGRVRTWRELAERRKRVSAIACASANLHAEALRSQKQRLAERLAEAHARRHAAVQSERPTSVH